jgi:hypothetical protein
MLASEFLHREVKVTNRPPTTYSGEYRSLVNTYLFRQVVVQCQ